MTTHLNFCGMKAFVAEGTRSVKDQALAERLNVAGDAQREGAFELADTILRQVLADHAHMELPVDVLCPLTVRTLSILYRQAIVTVADLVKCTLPDLRDWYNFGPRSRTLLGARMRTFELNLAREQHDYKWAKERVKKNKRQPLDRCLLLPTFALPNEQPTKNVFENYEGPLCERRVLGTRRDYYPDTEPPCALPLDHPFHCLSAQDIADERTWRRWTRDNERRAAMNGEVPMPVLDVTPAGEEP